jgi:GNAT superfamily N-acetyltransferase
VAVRLRRATDVPACVDALTEVYCKNNYPTRWPRDPAGWLTPPTLLIAWVAADSAAIQAHLALVTPVEDEQLRRATARPSDEIAAVARLFVRPADRGQRLGERLLRTAMTFAAQRDLALVLDVVEDSQPAAIRLYERLGWQLIGRRPADWLTPNGVRPLLRLYVLPRNLLGSGAGSTATSRAPL